MMSVPAAFSLPMTVNPTQRYFLTHVTKRSFSNKDDVESPYKEAGEDNIFNTQNESSSTPFDDDYFAADSK